MKKKIKSKKLPSKRLPEVKKNIRGFLLSEEGKIDKKNIAKIGISLALLQTMLDPRIANAGHQNEYQAHVSSWHDPYSFWIFSGNGGHESNTPHMSHDSSHDNGGWC